MAPESAKSARLQNSARVMFSYRFAIPVSCSTGSAGKQADFLLFYFRRVYMYSNLALRKMLDNALELGGDVRTAPVNC